MTGDSSSLRPHAPAAGPIRPGPSHHPGAVRRSRRRVRSLSVTSSVRPPPFTAVAVAPDGGTVAVAEDGGTVDVWSVSVLRGVIGDAASAASSARTASRSTASSGRKRWTRSQTRRLSGHADGVDSIAFSPAGRPARHGQPRRDRPDLGRRHRSHARGPARARRRPSRAPSSTSRGNLVVTTGADGTTRVWQAANGLPVTTLRGPSGRLERRGVQPRQRPHRHGKRRRRRADLRLRGVRLLRRSPSPRREPPRRRLTPSELRAKGTRAGRASAWRGRRAPRPR